MATWGAYFKSYVKKEDDLEDAAFQEAAFPKPIPPWEIPVPMAPKAVQRSAPATAGTRTLYSDSSGTVGAEPVKKLYRSATLPEVTERNGEARAVVMPRSNSNAARVANMFGYAAPAPTAAKEGKEIWSGAGLGAGVTSDLNDLENLLEDLVKITSPTRHKAALSIPKVTTSQKTQPPGPMAPISQTSTTTPALGLLMSKPAVIIDQGTVIPDPARVPADGVASSGAAKTPTPPSSQDQDDINARTVLLAQQMRAEREKAETERQRCREQVLEYQKQSERIVLEREQMEAERRRIVAEEEKFKREAERFREEEEEMKKFVEEVNAQLEKERLGEEMKRREAEARRDLVEQRARRADVLEEKRRRENEEADRERARYEQEDRLRLEEERRLRYEEDDRLQEEKKMARFKREEETRRREVEEQARRVKETERERSRQQELEEGRVRYKREQEQRLKFEKEELQRQRYEKEEAERLRFQRAEEEAERLGREEEDSERLRRMSEESQRVEKQAETAARFKRQAAERLRLQEQDTLFRKTENAFAGQERHTEGRREKQQNVEEAEPILTKEEELRKAEEKIRLAFAGLAQERGQLSGGSQNQNSIVAQPQTPSKLSKAIKPTGRGPRINTGSVDIPLDTGVSRFNTIAGRTQAQEKPLGVTRGNTVGSRPAGGLPSGPRGGVLPRGGKIGLPLGPRPQRV